MKRLSMLILLTPALGGSMCRGMLRAPDAVATQVRVDTLGVVYLDSQPLNTSESTLEKLHQKIPPTWKPRKGGSSSMTAVGMSVFDKRGLVISPKCVYVRCAPAESLKKHPSNTFSGVIRLPGAKPISCPEGPHLKLALDAMDPSRTYRFGDSFDYKNIEVGTNKTPAGGLSEVWFCKK